ncbi:hypothetical protein MASR2M78_01240 [Treponema sp.]
MDIMSFIATLLSSVLLSLALPNEIVPYGLAILGFFCLAPYFAALQKSKSKKHAALLGALFGSLSHALSSYWLYFFQDYAVWTIGATSVAYAFLHAILAVFLRHLSQNKHRFCSPALRPILLAAAWTVWEWLKSIGFLGYPWGLLPYSVNDVPFLIQISDSVFAFYASASS